MTFRLLMLVAVTMSGPAGSDAQALDEYQVKAAFVYNFAKFIEWPQGSLRSPDHPFTVCVLQHNPFGQALESTIRGKSIQGRPLAFRQITDVHQCAECQILFISSLEARRFRSLPEPLKQSGILTVGEAPGFASNGGVINFKIEDGHVRFEINIEAAERARLHISSKLLSLAQIVRPEKIE